MTKHLIIGFATNQTPQSLAVFLRSARLIYPTEQCDIALITNSVSGIEDILLETGAIVINTPSTYSTSVSKLTKTYNRIFLHILRGMSRSGVLFRSPEIAAGYDQLIESWHHPHFARWFAYMRVMRTFYAYDKILLADTKDVVFQQPFFDQIQEDAVSLFEDGESFAPEGWNGRWYIQAYGRKGYDKIAHRQPICIGVVAGGAKTILSFVTDLCAAIARHPFGRIEQAIFNKMYLNNEILVPLRIFENGQGAVLNMCGDGIEQRVECVDGLIQAKSDGRLFPIVHMYDRILTSREAVEGKYVGAAVERPVVIRADK